MRPFLLNCSSLSASFPIVALLGLSGAAPAQNQALELRNQNALFQP